MEKIVSKTEFQGIGLAQDNLEFFRVSKIIFDFFNYDKYFKNYFNNFYYLHFKNSFQ